MVPNLNLNFLDSPDKVGEFWQWLCSHHDYIAADTETTDLNWWHSSFRVRLFQFGDTETGWAIPFQEWKGLVAGALKWLADRRVLTVWHNLAFDYQALKSEGIVLDLSCQHDTFIWANLVGFAEESRKLKNMAARYFGQWALFGAKMLDRGMHNGGWTWATVPMNFHPYTVYGAVDPILTAMYFEKIRKLMPPFMWHHSLEIASIDTTGLMMRNGLAVDTQYAFDQLQILNSREAEVLDRLSEHGITSANQNAAVARVLEEAGVVPDIAKRTGTGQLQVDKAFLETITHPVAHEVLLARRIHKTGTYFKAMLREAQGVLSPRELIHPNIRAIEAKTGRMSIADPALQQLPAPDDDDPETQIVRRAVIPRTDDEILVGADFGQIELRVFASLTNDQNLLAVLKETDAAKARGDHANADFFVAMGRDVYHDPTFKKSDHRRKLLKATCVPMDVRILTRSGFRTRNDISVGDETLGYDAATGRTAWTKITMIHDFKDQPVLTLRHGNNFEVRCTPGHRWITDRGPVEAASLRKKDRLTLAAPLEGPGVALSLVEAEVLGWLLSDGQVVVSPIGGRSQGRDNSRRQVKAAIFQSKSENIQRIEEILCDIPHHHFGNTWQLTSPAARDLITRAGLMTDTAALADPRDFAASLTINQREAVLKSIIAADGARAGATYPTLVKGDAWHTELYRWLLFFSGKRTRVYQRHPDGKGWAKKPWNVIKAGAAVTGMQRTTREQTSVEDVWCVTTELDTVTFEFSGQPYLTHNCYATMYSAGEERIASTAKVSQPEIHAVLEAMKERYVAFRTLGEELLTNEGIGPYGEPVASVRTPTGRRFAVAHRDERRKLLNYLIQGHSAEVLKMAIQNVREAGYEDELLLPVHDELIMSVPKGTEEKATRDLVECMNAVIDPSQYGVAIQASAGTPAMSWAELSH